MIKIGRTCDWRCLRPVACVMRPEDGLQPRLEVTIEESRLRIISFGRLSKCRALICHQDRLNYLGRSCNRWKSRPRRCSHFATYTFLSRFFNPVRIAQHMSLLLLTAICPCHVCSLHKNLLSSCLLKPRCIVHCRGNVLLNTRRDRNLLRENIQFQSHPWNFLRMCLHIHFGLRHENSHNHVACRFAIILRSLT